VLARNRGSRFVVPKASAFVLTALVAVLAGGSSAAAGTFPGKNGPLIFDAVDGTTHTVQIFQVAAGGTGLKQLTKTTGTIWNEDPTFSANAQTIYFNSMDRSTTNPSLIYRMRANGTGRQLSDSPSAPTHVWPSVNSTGSTVAVVQYGSDGLAVIATMQPNGTNRRVVAPANSLQGNGGPAYAPSGARLVFYRVTYNSNGQGFASSDLFVRNGTRNNNITARSSALFFGASWAPGGQQLVAVRGQGTLVTMNANGTGTRVVTTVPANANLVDAVFSPNGKQIAYLQCVGDCGDPFLQGQGSVWVVNTNGTGKRRVFNGTSAVQPANRLSWGVATLGRRRHSHHH
jgi:Tol biopolymer transport system component